MWIRTGILCASRTQVKIGLTVAIHANVDVVAELRQQVRHVAVDRRKNARALKIHLRLAELGFDLRDARLGAQALRIQRRDLSLHESQVFQC